MVVIWEILTSMADGVRTLVPTDARLPTRRTFEERVYVRWPGLYAAFARTASVLPARSRLRRALLRRGALSGWGAWSRGDLELMLVRYAPDCHVEAHREMMAVGMRGIYTGHSGLRELATDLRDAWERMDLIPREIIDAGDVVVVLGNVQLRARGSGIELDTTVGSVLWAGSGSQRGRITRERDCAEWDEALRVAGISASAAGSDG